MHFVVVGGDAAGMSAASRAKRHQPDLDVTVLEQTGDVSYSACGMPYNLAEPERDIEDLVVRRAEVFRKKQGIDLRIDHRATDLDPATRRISGSTADGNPFELSYDRLLIATGASAIRPALPGFDLPGVMCLKNLEDGRRIKLFLRERPVKRVVIIGMGYIALEMCETLRTLDIAVTMVKARPDLLPWMDRQLADVVGEEMAAHDVTLHMGQAIERIEHHNGSLCVCTADKRLEGEMVLVAVGVKPNSQIAADAGLALSVGGSIAVDAGLRTSLDGVFAAGDCADARHVVSGAKVWIPLALRANRAGWAVADNVVGKRTALPGVAGTAVFRAFNLEVARTGFTADEAAQAGFDPVTVTIKSRSRAHAHPGASMIWVHMVGDRSTQRLLGVQMVGREGVAHRINAPAVALHAHMSVADFSQTDLAYAPPFGPVWDPMLTAANQLVKQLTR